MASLADFAESQESQEKSEVMMDFLEGDDFTSIASPSSLVSPDASQFELFVKRIRMLMEEGRGECIYDVGVTLGDFGLTPSPDKETNASETVGLTSDEFDAAVATLQSVAASLNADCVSLREKQIGDSRRTAQYLIRHRADERDFMEVRCAVVGNVDAGKSTLLGVLTHGELDNGRGYARQKLFRHKHEAESGRTSSVGNDILGFDSSGQVVNKPDHGNLDWVRVCRASSKVITFIDLAGHEKYLKTTVFGMTGHAPDFGNVLIMN